MDKCSFKINHVCCRGLMISGFVIRVMVSAKWLNVRCVLCARKSLRAILFSLCSRRVRPYICESSGRSTERHVLCARIRKSCCPFSSVYLHVFGRAEATRWAALHIFQPSRHATRVSNLILSAVRAACRLFCLPIRHIEAWNIFVSSVNNCGYLDFITIIKVQNSVTILRKILHLNYQKISALDDIIFQNTCLSLNLNFCCLFHTLLVI